MTTTCVIYHEWVFPEPSVRYLDTHLLTQVIRDYSPASIGTPLATGVVRAPGTSSQESRLLPRTGLQHSLLQIDAHHVQRPQGAKSIPHGLMRPSALQVD